MNPFRVVKYLLVVLAVFVGLGLAGALAVHLYGAHRLATTSRRFEREVGPLSVQALMRPALPVEGNAVTWLRPGVLAVVFFPGDQALVGSLSAKPFADWGAGDAGKLDAILDRSKPALTLLERARGMKESNWDIPYQEGTTAKIPNLLAAMNAAKLLTARGRLALGRGDRETAIAAAETLGVLARSHEAESASIVLLIGLAIEKLQIALVHEILSAPSASAAELDRLGASSCDKDLTSAMRESLRGSAVAVGHDVGGGSWLMEVHNAAYRRVARLFRSAVTAAAIEAHRDAEKDLGRPIRAPLGDTPADDGDATWWKSIVGPIGPNLASMSARATATASARDLSRLSIALRRAAIAGGRYPLTLPAIEGVAAIDPLSGETRVYEVHADGSAELRSTTNAEIVRSIFPVGQIAFESLYRWTLPAPRAGR